MKLLLENGAQVVAYDPVAADNFRKVYPEGAVGRGSIAYSETPEETLKDANICFVFTEWEQIRSLQPETFKEQMRIPLVYDGRNVFDVKRMKEAGIEYYSIGR